MEYLKELWASFLQKGGEVAHVSFQSFEFVFGGLKEKMSSWLNHINWADPTERVATTMAVFLPVTVLILLALLFSARRSRKASEEVSVVTRQPKRIGFFAAGALVVFFGGWSIYAPLSSAALAVGVVSPDGNRKTVAHLEGGIVRSIDVEEGDHVEQGDALVVLEDIEARSNYEALQERWFHLLAMRARLVAQQSGSKSITFPGELTSRADEANVTKAMHTQNELLKNQLTTMASREKILNQRVLQLEEQNLGLQDVTVAQDQQIALIGQEIDGVQQLFDQGLAEISRLLALERARADLEGERAANRARIAENGQRIGETRMQLLAMKEQRIEAASDELAEIERHLAEIRSQMPTREDRLKRTVVRAPVTGTVLNVQTTTTSGVIRPGEPILEIVPKEAKLIIDAKVSPNDIDKVSAGMEARVVLTAYRQRNLPLIHGVLRTVSADRLVEDRTGQPYFLAKVEVLPEDLDRLEDVRLMPGMHAEIMILNGKQTLLQYLLDPILQSVNRSFRES